MTDNRRCLVADIGGSNARFALAHRTAEGVELEKVLSVRCDDHAGLMEAIGHYAVTAGAELPAMAAVAIAGPVVSDHAEITNHASWSFSISDLRRRLGLSDLTVINDFTAIALSLPHLQSGDLRQVGAGAATAEAPMAVIGPGTGLGASGIVRANGRWTAVEGEGGHATFAPMSDRESQIGDLLRRRFGHVSWERVLSGPGLVNLHGAIAELVKAPAEAVTPEAIVARARDKSCPVCREAVGTFSAMLGTAAGNLALTLGARGGVFIGGGIVLRLADAFDATAFRARFEGKGRLSEYLRPIPTFIIEAPNPGLIGAATAVLG